MDFHPKKLLKLLHKSRKYIFFYTTKFSLHRNDVKIELYLQTATTIFVFGRVYATVRFRRVSVICVRECKRVVVRRVMYLVDLCVKCNAGKAAPC